jgi:two-component system response regulator AtoC
MSGILIVDDDPMMLRYMRSLLECEGYSVCACNSGADALAELRSAALPDVILLDMVMPEMDGIETLTRILELAPSAKVIMLSGQHAAAGVVQAIKIGAVDYLTKPVDEERLLAALRLYTPAAAQREEADLIFEELSADNFFLAAAPAMRKVFDQVERIARVEVPVLITGESGTGKEIIALLLHKYSPRANKRFLKVNCAAIPEELLESELFGYEAGAFTGASKGKPGYFEQCDHGTILLDEIGEMPPRLQAKLLQVLQEERFFRLGGKSPVEVDVRILAATNINVKLAVEQGRLRLDLYYRLNAFNINLPPLRERREEIAPLFRHFMKRLAYLYRHPPRPLTEPMLQSLMQHSWPGNLRELHNVVKRYLVLGEEVLTAAPAVAAFRKVTGIRGERSASSSDLKQIVRELKGEAEAEAIRNALEQTQWRRKEAAELLGICYKALIYKSRQYGILSPREKMLPKSTGPEPVRAMSLAGAGAATKINGGRIPALKTVGMKDAEDLR